MLKKCSCLQFANREVKCVRMTRTCLPQTHESEPMQGPTSQRAGSECCSPSISMCLQSGENNINRRQATQVAIPRTVNLRRTGDVTTCAAVPTRCLLGAEAPATGSAGTRRPELGRPQAAHREFSPGPGPPWSWMPRRAGWSAARLPWRTWNASGIPAGVDPWRCGARRGRPRGGDWERPRSPCRRAGKLERRD